MLGPIEGAGNNEESLSIVLSAFQDALGPEGTLVVHTPFEDYARFGTPYILEESPSRGGPFSEYVRTRPGARRSLHPIVSVTALGARAAEIADGPHYDGFGIDSPWHRMHVLSARLVCLGIDLGRAFSFAHHIERLYGVPYQYTKLFSAPVYSGGEEIPGLFTMSVRYLDYDIELNTSRVEKILLEKGLAKEVPIGMTFVQSVGSEDAIRTGIELLREDRYAFLSRPPKFRTGEMPCDGLTGPMRKVYDKGSSAESQRPKSD